MSHKKYKKKELYFNIPIITITAVVGFISALNIQFEHIHIIIGLLSLYVSLLKSYLSFLKISQKNENHRVAYLQYFQIANEMRIELSLSPELRKRPSYLLSLIKVKMKNLNEVSELIPSNVIREFKQNEEYNNKEMTQPDIIMTTHTFEVYRNRNRNEIMDTIEETNKEKCEESNKEKSKSTVEENVKDTQEITIVDINEHSLSDFSV